MENEFKGTQGKWVLLKGFNSYGVSIGNKTTVVFSNRDSEEIANAQLISKAPELLERIKEQNIDLKILKNNLIKISESNKLVVGYSEIVKKWIDENENLIKEATTI